MLSMLLVPRSPRMVPGAALRESVGTQQVADAGHRLVALENEGQDRAGRT